MSNGELTNMKVAAFRECKKSASSYLSKQGFIKDLERRRNGVRSMIADIEIQADVLRHAESALSAQLDKLCSAEKEDKPNEESKAD